MKKYDIVILRILPNGKEEFVKYLAGSKEISFEDALIDLRYEKLNRPDNELAGEICENTENPFFIIRKNTGIFKYQIQESVFHEMASIKPKIKSKFFAWNEILGEKEDCRLKPAFYPSICDESYKGISFDTMSKLLSKLKIIN